MSLLSMTGFGRGTAKEKGVLVSCDIRTVNNRFLDLNLRIPRAYMPLENKIRELISARLSRGRVDLFLNVEKNSAEAGNLNLNTALAKKYFAQIKELQKNLHLKDEVKTPDILALEGVVSVTEKLNAESEDWLLISKAVQKALDALLAMRKKEGQALKLELTDRMKCLRQTAVALEGEVGAATAALREKLNNRINALITAPEIDQDRFSQEIAILLSRSDVTEEVARLRTHLDQFDFSLKEGSPVGKRLDFLLQEMNREITTYSNKLQGVHVSKLIVEAKSEVEKIKEQIQNLE